MRRGSTPASPRERALCDERRVIFSRCGRVVPSSLSREHWHKFITAAADRDVLSVCPQKRPSTEHLLKPFFAYLHPRTVGNHMSLDWNLRHSSPQLIFRAKMFVLLLWDYANQSIQIQFNSHFWEPAVCERYLARGGSGLGEWCNEGRVRMILDAGCVSKISGPKHPFLGSSVTLKVSFVLSQWTPGSLFSLCTARSGWHIASLMSQKRAVTW